jgi:hypothetical protein
METGLLDAVLKLYHTVSGNRQYTPSDICKEFANVHIDSPLAHNSGISGKIATNRHILEKDICEESINTILAEM